MQVTAQLKHSTHLIRRFFGFLRARRLAPAEQIEVRMILGSELSDLFFAQRPEDQRHSLSVSSAVRELGGTPEEVIAALVHDIGKSDTGLGAIGRALATVGAGLRLPLKGSWARYRDHGERGALMLEQAGASALAVAFARHHPGPIPPDVEAEVWNRLAEADHLAG